MYNTSSQLVSQIATIVITISVIAFIVLFQTKLGKQYLIQHFTKIRILKEKNTDTLEETYYLKVISYDRSFWVKENGVTISYKDLAEAKKAKAELFDKMTQVTKVERKWVE